MLSSGWYHIYIKPGFLKEEQDLFACITIDLKLAFMIFQALSALVQNNKSCQSMQGEKQGEYKAI